MIRCANSGVTAAIDSVGSTAHPDTGKPQELRDSNGSCFTRGSMLAEVDIPLKPRFTVYAMIGDLGVVGLSLFGLIVGILANRR